MSVNSKMTAIADKIRALTGQTGKLGLDKMDLNLEIANTDKSNMITTLKEMGIVIEDGASLSDIANLLPTVESGTDTSDATATASDILKDKTAYVDGEKITGAFTIDNELTTQDNIISQIQTALNGKTSATPTLQTKTISPSTSVQTITPDSGYDGLSQVTVNAMTTATQATPTVSIDSAGKITATATQTAGYVAAGTKTGTKQLTTQEAKTITPSTSSQTAVAKNVYTTGAITVGAIPSTYVKPTTTKAATTYTPTTSNQTIAAGTYCSGVQTIKGDANLKAENIAEGVSIFGVTGTHSGGSGSGGGSVETCTLVMEICSPIASDCYVYYIDGNMKQQSAVISMFGSATITVLKNSLLCITTGVMNNPSNLTFVYDNVYYISGDATAHY